MALGEALALFLGELAGTFWALDAFFVIAGGHVLGADWVFAAEAHAVLAGLEVVVDGDAVIKDEALAFPETFFLGDFLEIFKDAAFEVVNFLETLGEHERAGFLTADTAGAKHGYFFVLLDIDVVFNIFWKFAE